MSKYIGRAMEHNLHNVTDKYAFNVLLLLFVVIKSKQK